MQKFHLTVAKLDKELYSKEAVSLTVPAENGEMTILAHHTATLAKLKPGKAIIKEDENKDPVEIELEKGILEFSNNSANLMLF